MWRSRFRWRTTFTYAVPDALRAFGSRAAPLLAFPKKTLSVLLSNVLKKAQRRKTPRNHRVV